MPFEFLLTVLASTAGTTVLLGVAAFLGRSQISHWLAKDLEQQKAEYARQLENHKVSLIAHAEQAKSAAAIKQASALLLVEKKLDAYSNLFKSLNTLHTDIASMSTRDVKTKEEANRATQAVNDFLHSMNAALPFLASQDYYLCKEYWQMVRIIVSSHCRVGTPPFPEERWDKADDVSERCREMLINRMREMTII